MTDNATPLVTVSQRTIDKWETERRVRNAAPDMLAALQDAEWFLGNLNALLPAGWEKKVAATDPRPAIRAALAKAGAP